MRSTFYEARKEWERTYFERLIAECEGNIALAARTAVLNRTALYQRLTMLGISRASECHRQPRPMTAMKSTFYAARKEWERTYFESLIAESKGNIALAARTIRLNRTLLYQRLRLLGILNPYERRKLLHRKVHDIVKEELSGFLQQKVTVDV